VCWWASDREPDHREALEQQITPAEVHSHEIEADHFEIVRADLLLQGIGAILMRTSLEKSSS
jgi:hypothetical protein